MFILNNYLLSVLNSCKVYLDKPIIQIFILFLSHFAMLHFIHTIVSSLNNSNINLSIYHYVHSIILQKYQSESFKASNGFLE